MIPLKRKQPEPLAKRLERLEAGATRSDAREPPVLVGFGKYKDFSLQEVAEKDPEYCKWVLTQHSSDNFRMRRLQDFLQKTTDLAKPNRVQSQVVESVSAPVPPWVQRLLSLSQEHEEDISEEMECTALTGLPGETVGLLHGYQRRGIAFGVKKGGRVLLADEMGLGKTVQALGVAAFYRREWPVLVVVPAALRLNWKSEIARWLREATVQVVMSGSDQFRAGKDFYIVSYDLCHRHAKFRAQATGEPFDLVICDESHLLKTWQTQRTSQIVPIVQTALRAVLISGSPALNNAFELYPQLKALQKDIPTPEEFGRRYCVAETSPQGQNVFTGSVRPNELRQVLSSVMLRRAKAEVLSQLPQKRRRMIPLELPPGALQSAENVQGGDEDKGDKGYQSAYARVGLAKAELAAEYVDMLCEALPSEDKLLVFFHHEVVGSILEAKLKAIQISHVRIDGKTPPAKRELEAARFQEDASVRIAVLSITACGLGLTLTAASVIVFAELYSVPKVMEQAEDRAHRIGQSKSVDVHYLVAPGSIDDSILATMARKVVELRDLLAANALGADAPEAAVAGTALALADVRASARPLQSTGKEIRAAFARATENEKVPEATKAGTVRSRALAPSAKNLGKNHSEALRELTSMGFDAARASETLERTSNVQAAVELLLIEEGTLSSASRKRPMTLSDSDSDVQIEFD